MYKNNSQKKAENLKGYVAQRKQEQDKVFICPNIR